MQAIHQVIVIGCGISGIGASHELSKHNIEHIIIQSRSRIGGRIFTEYLNGFPFDMGAMVVHHPNEDNLIKQIMDKIGWKYQNKRYTSKQIMLEGGKEIDQDTKERGIKVYQEILEKLENHSNKSEKDLSFAQAMSTYVQEKALVEKAEVMTFVNLLLKIHGNIEGAELQEISAKDLYVDDQTDVIPEYGYFKLLETIFDLYPRPPIHLNQKVLTIDYSNEIIKITTNIQTYYCKRLISSLPLGVLKSKQVKFQPPLPERMQQSIENIGVGVFNKVILSFAQPFWDTKKQYILLVSQKEDYYRIRSFIDGDRYILCAYVSGEASKRLSKLRDQEIVEEFVACLHRHYKNAQIKVNGHLITRWHLDQHSLGSYSFFPACKGSVDDVFELRSAINDKIWFTGEHCAPEFTATAHAALRSGINAAKAISIDLKKNLNNK